MKTELEAEVREAFAVRAGHLPTNAASRLRSIDYGPREHRLRAPAIGVGALAGAATVGTALAVMLGGSTPAYAGWSASPPASGPASRPVSAAEHPSDKLISGQRKQRTLRILVPRLVGHDPEPRDTVFFLDLEKQRVLRLFRLLVHL